MSNKYEGMVIRKITPCECFRLMGFGNPKETENGLEFDDGAYERASKKCSNSQLYKQSGNSIVTDCICAILSTMMESEDE